MKATIESTDKVVEISDPSGRRCAARVWQGTSEEGVEFVAYITQIQVRRGQGRTAEFDRELTRSGPADAETLKAIELRYIV